MKNKDFFIKSFLVALLTLLVIIAADNLVDPFARHEDVFTVSADASVFAKPDLAKINLEIIRESNTVTIVQQQLNQVSNGLIDQLKQIDVAEKDIKTTNYSISPKYSYNRETGQSYIYGFRGQISLEVKIRDFDRVDRVINTGQVTGLNFEIENKDELLAQARQEAIQKAKAKAKKTAQEAGISLGKLISVEVSEDNYIDYPRYEMAKLAAAPDEAPSAQIQPGENEIKIYVSLSYEIK